MAMEAAYEPRKPTAADLRARLIGRSLDHDREEIRYWQQASEQERGQALAELLALAGSIMAATRTTRQEPSMLVLKRGRILIQPRA